MFDGTTTSIGPDAIHHPAERKNASNEGATLGHEQDERLSCLLDLSCKKDPFDISQR